MLVDDVVTAWMLEEVVAAAVDVDVVVSVLELEVVRAVMVWVGEGVAVVLVRGTTIEVVGVGVALTTAGRVAKLIAVQIELVTSTL